MQVEKSFRRLLHVYLMRSLIHFYCYCRRNLGEYCSFWTIYVVSRSLQWCCCLTRKLEEYFERYFNRKRNLKREFCTVCDEISPFTFFPLCILQEREINENVAHFVLEYCSITLVFWEGMLENTVNLNPYAIMEEFWRIFDW